jgi:hypothetical protein
MWDWYNLVFHLFFIGIFLFAFYAIPAVYKQKNTYSELLKAITEHSRKLDSTQSLTHISFLFSELYDCPIKIYGNPSIAALWELWYGLDAGVYNPASKNTLMTLTYTDKGLWENMYHAD